MTTNEEFQEPKDHRLMYIVRFKILAFKKNQESYTTIIESEFLEETPLKSRQLAFKHYRKIYKILLELEEKEMLGYSKPALEDEYIEGRFSGQILFSDFYYNWDRNRILKGDSEIEFKNSLIFEYDYFMEQGLDTGETVEIEDNFGKKHKVIPYR